MLANLIREFCAKSEDKYKVYEGYSGRAMFGRKTIGIIVRQGHSYLDMMMELTSFLEEREFEDPLLELDGTSADALGLDVIVYFPAIQDYQYPLQPEE